MYKSILAYLLILLFVIFPTASFSLQQTEISHLTIASKTLIIDKHPIYYNELGQGETVLLIHGLFANKEQWQEMMPLLAKKYFRVIAVDLPGYGKSLGFPNTSYGLKEQVNLLHVFMNKLKIQRFHLAGNSMGGAISALYTLKYPKEVATLAFIGAPLGVTTPKASPTDKLFQQGKDPFLPLTRQQARETLKLLFVKQPKISEQELKVAVQQNIAQQKLKQQIIDGLYTYKNLFAKPLTITTPTLIIWGENDNIFNISGAEVLHKNIPHSQLVILNNIGHLPQVEAAEKTADIYLQFLMKYKGIL